MVVARISPQSSVLEFGCSSGRMTKYMAQTLQCSVSIAEIDEAAYRKAREYAVNGFCGDIESYAWQDVFAGEQFDVILFTDVLEHLRNPMELLQRVKPFLKSTGEILVSIPNIGHFDILANLYLNRFTYTDIGLLDNTHVHFWGKNDLEGFFEKAGFSLTLLDGVYQPPYETEQKVDRALITDEVSRALMQHPYCDVYQFFCVLQKQECTQAAEAQPVVRLESHGLLSPAYFYWDTGAGYQADAYVKVSVDSAASGKYRVDQIPAHCRKVRFDPILGVACIVHHLSIACSSGVCQHTVLNGTEVGDSIVFSTMNPQIEVALPGETTWIEVTAAVAPITDPENMCLLQVLDRLPHFRECEQQLQEVNLQAAALQQDYEKLQQQCRIQLAESEQRKLELAEALQERDARLTEAGAALAEAAQSRNELAEALQERDARLAEAGAALAEAAQSRNELAEALQERDAYARHVENLYHQLAEQFNGVMRSECWRMTAPIRHVLDWIRARKSLHLIGKGLRYWKHFGWSATWDHLQQRHSEKRRAAAPSVQPSTVENFAALAKKMTAGSSQKNPLIYSASVLKSYDRCKGKKILFISHELDLTGAPMAVRYFALCMKQMGCCPVIISPRRGKLTATLEQDQIPALICDTIYTDDTICGLTNLFDLVVATTIVSAPVISRLNGMNLPVIWWIHEAEASYHPGALEAMPAKLLDNIHVYCGGMYAQKVLSQYRPDYESQILLYCVPEKDRTASEPFPLSTEKLQGKIVFALVGAQEERKGQDILADAILAMPENQVKQCCFVFVGRPYFPSIEKKLREVCNAYPDHVFHISEVNPLQLQELYQQMDCLICASRDDPMPIVVTEALMCGKEVICSENTGSAFLLNQYGCGLVYHGNDAAQLRGCIEQVLAHPQGGEAVKRPAAKLYQENFSLPAFEQHIREIFDQILISPKETAANASVSVVIPTYNAGKEFPALLDSLKTQSGVGRVELVIVDSGSRDKTVTLAKEFGAVVVEIPQAEFSHSHARNLGAEHATGEYLLFMTQDAIPGTTRWLQEMLVGVISRQAVAASCRQEPRADCDLMGRVGIYLHSRYMGIEQNDRVMAMPREKTADALRRNSQLDDVACLIRREVFCRYGYRGDYAEDLDLGLRLIEDGYRLALLSSAYVVHSHTRPAIYHLKRAIVDTISLKKILPNLPVKRIDEGTVRNEILSGYCLLLAFLHQMELAAEVDSVEELCQQIKRTYAHQITTEARDLLQQRQGSMSSETMPLIDTGLQEFIQKLYEISPAVQFDAQIFDGILDFMTESVPTYLRETAAVWTDETKQEWYDTLVKRFGQIAGCELAYYAMCWPNEENALTGLIQFYRQGV
ncbi:glycosyltransferase [Oscillibacter valericigenes]|nr:glycosyltransferase [Oscillibacter valericigenes]